MSEEKQNEYNEPWTSSDGRVLNDNNRIVYNAFKTSSLDAKQDILNAERVVKLMNLFAGVNDEVIDKLVTMRTDEQSLAIAVLQNPLDKTPLCMLIDAVQDTPQYQKQLACYRTWKQFYDLVFDVATRLREATDDKRHAEVSRSISRSAANELFRFIAPLIQSNPEKEADVS